ncbi:MAG: amidohydrolase family protein [Vicinamibacterales bacterium]
MACVCHPDGGAPPAAPTPARRLSRRAWFREGAIGAAALAAPGLAAAQAPSRPPDGAYVIDAGWALTTDAADRPALVRDAAIVVERGVIAEVRTGAARAGLPRVDARRMLVLPGFISGHTHVCSGTPTRGLIEGGRSYARPLEIVESLDDASLDALTAINLAELLRSGCTTQVEMSLSLRQAESYVRVATRWGARGYPAPMVPGTSRLFGIWQRKDDATLTASVPGTLDEIAAARRFAEKYRRSNDGLIRAQMAPHATDTHTPETLRAMIDAAKAVGNGLHLHLAQGARETETVTRLWGQSPVRWLAALGAFDQPVFGAHMAGVDWNADGPVLKQQGVVFAHCPSAGGAGGDTMPYPEALGAGVRVNIGIDTHSNDYVENLKLAVLYGQARHGLLARTSPAPLGRPTIADAVESATRVPATALGRDDLGRLRAGARADVTAIDVTGLLVGTGALPPEPLNHLLYAHGSSVRHVAVDGRWQVFDGRLVVDDEARVVNDGGRVVQTVWQQLEREGWFR